MQKLLFKYAVVVAAIGFFAPTTSEAAWIALTKSDGIKTVSKRASSTRGGIAKRAGVQLTRQQATFVSKFGAYLHSIGESAVVTSGARSPEHQLSIIKSKVREAGATRMFPKLAHASVSKPSTWLSAWEWLRGRHVPVNAPGNAGGEAQASNHIKGLAVDMISGSLDHLRNLVLGFASSVYAMHSPLKVTTIAREPGCVHVNLRP